MKLNKNSIAAIKSECLVEFERRNRVVNLKTLKRIVVGIYEEIRINPTIGTVKIPIHMLNKIKTEDFMCLFRKRGFNVSYDRFNGEIIIWLE